MKFFLTVFFILAFSIPSHSQDSSAFGVYINSSFGRASYSLPLEIGGFYKPMSRKLTFFAGYSLISSKYNWTRYYDDFNDEYTSEEAILTHSNDSNMVKAQSESVNTISHGIRLGISKEWKTSIIDFHWSLSINGFDNKTELNHSFYDSYYLTNISTNENPPRRTRYLIKQNRITRNTSKHSFTTTFTTGLGVVFRMRDKLKLIPKLSFCIYPKKNELIYGSLYSDSKNWTAELKPAIRLIVNL